MLDLITNGILLGLAAWIAFAYGRVRSNRKIRIETQDGPWPGEILAVDSALGRRQGLLNTPHLEARDGILLLRSRRIHTLGMHFPIDLVFLDTSFCILECMSAVSPGQKKITGPRGTAAILELGAGTLDQNSQGLSPGSRLTVHGLAPRAWI